MNFTKHNDLFTIAATALLSSTALAAPSSGNMLLNSSFENGTNGWAAVSGSVTSQSYGSSGAPIQLLGDYIGGGNKLVMDESGNGILEQTHSLAGISGGMSLHFGGYFGGGSNDEARASLVFLDAGGTKIALRHLPSVISNLRNGETVLMLQESYEEIPIGAQEVVFRLEMINNCCGAISGAADAVFMEAVPTPGLPNPHPMNTQLLNNAGFEHGWISGSPLTPNGTSGWRGVNSSTCLVKPYSDTDATVPSTLVSCLIGGGTPGGSCVGGGAGSMLVDVGGGGAMRQRIDVRGNQSQFGMPGGISLLVSGFLGGFSNSADSAHTQVRFLDANLTTISALPAIGPVTRENRNEETVLLRREQEFLIPANTCYVEVEAAFMDACCGGTYGLSDNFEAMLVSSVPLPPVAKNVNLISNSGLEYGDLPGSPLELMNTSGWFGLQDTVQVKSYGQDSSVPGFAFAAANGLGGLLLTHQANGVLSQVIDLRGDQAAIAAGELNVHAEAWLGGFQTAADSAELRVRFVTIAGVQVGGPGGLQILAPVTAVERNNQTTLLKRESDFIVPPNTARMEVELIFSDHCCGSSYALADGIGIVVSGSDAPGSAFCFGDGSASACPCGNNGGQGEGCANSSGLGARLDATGSASVGADSVILQASGCPSSTPGLFFSGPNALAGNPFGGGLLCVGGQILRLGVVFTDSNGSAQSTSSLSLTEGLTGGELRNYQFWFRDVGGSCGSNFNTSNGYSIQW